MTVSLHDLSVNSYLQIYEGIIGCLDKGLGYCRENGINPDDISNARLFPDMNSFDFQVQAVTHHSVGALNAVKNGTYIPQPQVPAVGYEGLQKMLLDAREALRGMSAAEINGHEGGEVVFRYGDIAIPFTTENFLLSFSLPNFYFHAATAYDILRLKGVPVGKIDFLGQMRIKG